jgi:predicted nucleic acid-binding Zn ribbon protein
MKMQYRFECPNCGNEGYTCKQLFRDAQAKCCDNCGALFVLKLNCVTEEFDSSYFCNSAVTELEKVFGADCGFDTKLLQQILK